MLTGRTRAAGVIGSPIRHSLSPALFNAAFSAAGLDWGYLAFDVPDGSAGVAVAGMRALGIEGLSVTMPHKAAVIESLDSLSDEAGALGAVNCITNRAGVLHGDNTDGSGFIDALRLDEGLEVDGARCAVIGAGGAGRAVARALAQAGASSIVIINRTAGPAQRAVVLAGSVAKVGTPDDVRAVDLVVNATPLGMGVVVSTHGEGEPLPLDVSLLSEGQVVIDLVYHPAVTPLLTEARRRGLRTVNGLGMLIHQAAHAFRLWTNEEPPLEAMSAAAVATLSAR